MSKLLILLLAGLCCWSLAAAQTFQYSRGWTNGKRSSGPTATDNRPSLRQMTTNSLLMTANELNNRERLLQHIIKNPCDVRAALLASHSFKLAGDDDYASPSAELVDDDAINRFKRESELHH